MRHTRSRFVGVLGVLLALTLGACAEAEPKPASSPDATGGAFPVTAGGVTLDERPEKIVSLSPTATEMLFAIGAGDQVVAVDMDSDYPPQAPKTDMSGVSPNAEVIAGYQPDLVVISNDLNKIVDQLTRLRIPVYLAGAAATLDDTYRQITELGQLTGHVAPAEAVVQQVRDDIAKLVASVPQHEIELTYYYELDPTYYSLTSRTFVGSLFAMVGLTNIADAADPDGSKGGYPQLSPELLISADPDLIFLADTRCCQQSAETVAARSGWSGISAVRNGRVIALDDSVASRWGPRVVDLVRAITDAVAKVPA
jgi:iron complex transport system substrate-binding protein